MRYFLVPLALVCLTLNFAKASSYATFVSGTGVDSGACTDAAPCRTFRFALNQTSPGGGVTALTSGSFGPVITTKSISIMARGVTALIDSTIQCGSTARAAVCVSGASEVTLRGLTIDLHQTSASNLSGIRFNSGSALHVQNCAIRGAGAAAIYFEPSSGDAELFLSNTLLADNQGDGVAFLPHGGGSYTAKFDRVSVQNNVAYGLIFGDVNSTGALNGVVRDSVFIGNSFGVIAGYGDGLSTNLTISRSTVATNTNTGIYAFGGATVRVGNSLIAGNNLGLLTDSASQIVSFGTNKLTANGTDGAFTGTVASQ